MDFIDKYKYLWLKSIHNYSANLSKPILQNNKPKIQKLITY